MLLNSPQDSPTSPMTKDIVAQNAISAKVKKPHNRQSNVYTKKIETNVDFFFFFTLAMFLVHGKCIYLIIPFILCKLQILEKVGEGQR